MTRIHRWFHLLLTCALVLLFAAGFVLTIAHGHAEQPVATYTRGALSVTIPYHSLRSGSGRLVAEVLDPEDHVLGRAERTVEAARGGGSWQPVIQLEKPFADIVWQRLRYRFEYAGNQTGVIEGIEPISQILRRPVVHILGQTEYLTGSRAAIRVIVSDANNNDIAEPGTIRIELLIPEWNVRAHSTPVRSTNAAPWKPSSAFPPASQAITSSALSPRHQ